MSAQVQASGGLGVPSGRLGLQVIRGGAPIPVPMPTPVQSGPPIKLADYKPLYLPQRGLSDVVNEYRTRNLPNVLRRAAKIKAAQALGLPHFYGALLLSVLRSDGSQDDLGCVSLGVITTAGVTYICADIAGGANDSNLFKFHGFGTGTTAEASSDTALVTELTTEYATDNVRPTGSQAASTNTYTTVGTLSPDANVAITEHGIFTATSAGTLLDRSKFSAVNLVGSADSLQATYVLTLAAGG